MHISILTLFPEMFTGPFDASIIKRAKDKESISVQFINIRDYATDSYKTVDEHPYGGGQGMILRVDIVDKAIDAAKKNSVTTKTHTVLLTPQGTPYTQKIARELSLYDHLILVCGHYEGIDERIRSLVDSQISIGDYILTGGEIPAMVLVDSITRLLPHVFHKKDVTSDESFGISQHLEYPQYTKPIEYKGMKVPEILLSGDHAKISQWKDTESLKKTKTQRPDLL